MEKKLDGNYTKMLRAILNKSWRQYGTKQHLYGHQLPITKTIQVRRTRHAGHCWRNKDELTSDILLWTPSLGRAKAGRPGRNYIQQLSADTGYSLEDLPGAMDDREGWLERVNKIHTDSATRLVFRLGSGDPFLSKKTPDNWMRSILKEGLWFVRIPFSNMVKF